MKPPTCPGCKHVMMEVGMSPSTAQTLYRCACGYSAAVLHRPDGMHDLIIYDTNARVVQSVRLEKEDT